MSTGDIQLDGERPPAAGGTSGDEGVRCDVFDVLGYLAVVAAPAGDAATAVRAVFRGFGPVPTPPSAETPSFALEDDETGSWRVRADHQVVHTDESFRTALSMLEWHVVSAALAHREDLFHLHGSALCLPMRRAGLLLVGGSGRGKTTLTMGLMLRGFVPFADDVVLLDPDTLKLRALRRAFHITEQTWELLEPLSGPLAREQDELAGYFSPPQWAQEPVPVRWVLLPEYRPQQMPELIPLAPSAAAAAVVGQTLSLARAPRMALRAAARLTEQARCYRFLCGDLMPSVALVQRLVAHGTPASSAPSPRG